MIAQQVTRGEDQIIEVEQGRCALVGAEPVRHGRDRGQHLREHPRCDRALEVDPGISRSVVQTLGLAVQLATACLGQALQLDRSLPLPLLLILAPTGAGEERSVGLGDE